MTESGSAMPWTGAHGLSLANVHTSVRRFQQDFLRAVPRAHESGVCSPVSACVLLAMLEAAADGPTRAALRAALHIAHEEQDVPRLLGSALRALFDASGGDELESTSTAWVARSLAPRAEFVSTLEREYHASMMALDASRAADVQQAMHEWAAKHTRGRLACIPPPVTAETLLVLMNAIWFKGRWRTPFDPARTAIAPFMIEEHASTRVPVQMMSCVAPMYYREDRTFTAVLLPYVSGLSMVIVLPSWSVSNRHSVASTERALAETVPDEWVPKIQYDEVTVFLPRFRVSETRSLRPMCESLGLADLFTLGRADFSRAFGTTPVFVSDIQQEAMVEVNEAGTEAAALTTAIALGAASQPPPPTQPVTFRADHPFLFFIVRGHTVLFAGRVMQPAEA